MTGLAPGESLKTEPTLSCPADMSRAGRYTIIPGGAAVPEGGNYEDAILYVGGTLTVSEQSISDVTIRFDANGGNGTMASVRISAGSAYTLPISQFTRDEHDFSGWRIDNMGATYTPGEIIAVDEDITLYAQWTYSGSSNGGSASNGSRSRSSSGSSTPDGNPSRSTTTIVNTPTPTSSWLEGASARGLHANGQNQGTGTVRTSSSGEYGVRAQAFAAMQNTRFEHDTLLNGVVQVRLYIGEPEKVTNDTLVSGYVVGKDVERTRDLFQKWFINQVQVIHLDQQKD